MLTLYTLPSSTSCRKAVAYLSERNVPFVVQNMCVNSLTFEQMKQILYFTEEGLDEILANSKDRKDLEEMGIDFEEVTLSEFHYYLERHPKLFKAPIAISDDRMVVGFEEERYDVFKPRTIRTTIYNQQLEEVRQEENIRLLLHERISEGHRGKTLSTSTP